MLTKHMVSNRLLSHWTVTKDVFVILSMEQQDLIVALCAQLLLALNVNQKAKKN